MATAVADPPKQDTTSNSERIPDSRVSPHAVKNGSVPLEVMWERQAFENEQSLQNDKANAVAAAESIISEAKPNFPPTGSKPNEFRPIEVSDIKIQVEDKSVTKEEMTGGWSISGAIQLIESLPISKATDVVVNTLDETFSGASSLFTEDILPGKEKQPQDPEQTKEENDNRWIRNQQENLETKVENVTVQRNQENAENIARISEGQMSIQDVIEEVLQGVTFDVEDPASVAEVAYTGIGQSMLAWTDRQNKINAANQAKLSETLNPLAATGKKTGSKGAVGPQVSMEQNRAGETFDQAATRLIG